jgi:hypothetical protein
VVLAVAGVLSAVVVSLSLSFDSGLGQAVRAAAGGCRHVTVVVVGTGRMIYIYKGEGGVRTSSACHHRLRGGAGGCHHGGH